ncbi:hypothetical protein HGH92_23560 [Chitinophaga varians]|uniref:Uncharacterized protein n=1 Tax=Chitinophaga varians TaxID=2202339 RepID=A0A847RWA9_9BACT|nr:hypothetical protein [Chitinophaga varians]NLR67302.1 hypothetical protein [Chitinophaga varians]
MEKEYIYRNRNREMSDEIRKSIEPAELLKGVAALEKHFAGFAEMQERISHAATEFQKMMQSSFMKAAEAHDEMVQTIRRALDVDFSYMAPVLQELSQYGWYLNLGMNVADVAGAKRVLASGDENQLNVYMAEVLQRELTGDVARLCHRHPNRSEAIEQAFKAHNAGFYYASMPVVFAQVDGLSCELTGYKFFDNDKTRNFEPQIAKWVNAHASVSSLEVAYLSVLLDKGAFQKHRSNPNLISFTRHSILHGETTDYGTEINSLKAFSLLVFVSDMCTR